MLTALRALRWAILSTSVLCTATGFAQDGFRLDRFNLAPSVDDGFALQYAGVLSHLEVDTRLAVDYARKPLVTTSGQHSDVVRDSVGAQAALSVGLFGQGGGLRRPASHALSDR